MRSGLVELRRRGVALRRVVDGGACMGHWTILLKSVYPDAQILMLEPQTQHRDVLASVCARYAPDVRFESVLLGRKEAEAVPFNVMDDTSGGTGSSILVENSDVPRHVVHLPMTTLDVLLSTTGFGVPDLIKLDVQGYELEVLKGASLALASTPFVLLEVSVWQYNQGSPLIDEVLRWMKEAGFVTVDVFELSRRADGQLLQIDMLFSRQDAAILRDTVTRFRSASGH